MPASFAPLPPVPLSPVEDLVCRVDQRVNGSGRVAVVLTVEGDVDVARLRAAFAHVQHRHPKLRARITPRDGGRHQFEFPVACGPVPVSLVIAPHDRLPWRDTARRLLDDGFPPDGPLATAALLRATDRARAVLVLAVHHAVADGLSAIAIVDDLLAAYARLEADPAAAAPESRPAICVPQAPAAPDWRARLRLIGAFVRLWREEKRVRWTPLPEAAAVEPYSQWDHWVFTREDTLVLVRRCRQEKVSLSAVVIAAACRALLEELGRPEILLKCKFPIDFRETLSTPARPLTAQDLGCFVSFIQQFYRVSQDDTFWSLARRAHDDLQTGTRDGWPAFVYNSASAVRSVKPPRRTRRGTMLATNYGVLNIRDAYGGLRPAACTLVFKNDQVGPSLILEALVLGQRLNLGLAGFDLEPAFWERLRQRVKHHLDLAARPSRPQGATATSAPTNAQTDASPQRTSVAPQE